MEALTIHPQDREQLKAIKTVLKAKTGYFQMVDQRRNERPLRCSFSNCCIF